MANYNPNSVWDSKKKRTEKDVSPTYVAPEPAANPKAKQEPPETPSSAPARSFSVAEEVSEISSFVKKRPLPVFSAVLVGLLALIGLVLYLIRPASNPNVSISFTSPTGVVVGVPFTLHALLSNDSPSVLRAAEFTIELPDGMSFAGQNLGQRAMDQVIGEMAAGATSAQDLMIVATANPKSIQHITAKLIYGTDPTSKTQFESDGSADIVIGQPAIDLTFTSPSNIFSGHDFDIQVNCANTASETLNDVSVQLQYPPAFVFKSGTLPPGGVGNNTWDLGTLAPGATSTFKITGNIIGPAGTLYTLTGTASAGFSGGSYPANVQTDPLTIAASPLSLSLTLNGAADHIASAGETLSYKIDYQNNSNVTFESASIRASLVGAMFDLKTLSSEGTFDSRSNIITWYGANTPALRAIAPGQSGSVSFTVQAKPSFPIRLLSDKNYTLKVGAQISSPTVPPDTAGNGTVFATNIENKIKGGMVFTAKAYSHDTASGISNSGPYPPKVNQPTQYTVHWAIVNSATDLNNVSVSGYLQSGTTFTGQVKSNVSTTPTYDPGTGLVTWNIPLIPATAGVISPPVEAVFQIENTPAVNQVGKTVLLMDVPTVTATDAFTGTALTGSGSKLTTDLPDDTTVQKIPNRDVTQ